MQQTYLFYWEGRELTKIIRQLLYKWIIKEVVKENYVTQYTLENKKLIKKNVKKVTFVSEEDIKKYLNDSKFQQWL